MSQQIPTTQALSEDFVAQMDAATEHTTPLLARAYTRVLGKVQAGVYVLLYKYVGWMLLQQFIQHASMRETTILGRKIRPLVEWGRLVGAGDPLEATRAELTIAVQVQVQTGSLPAGSQLVFPSSGVVYVTTASIALNAATVYPTVRAVSDQRGGAGAGTVGNLAPGAVLQFAQPLPNVARQAPVTAQTVTGANAETEPAYRARIIRRVQAKPQGGAAADFRLWGEENPGIPHVYPYRGAPGEVDLYVEATEASSGSVDGIPTSGQLDAVKALVELDVAGRASRRPVLAFVNVLPITRTAFDVRVTGLESSDEAAAEAAIEDAVDEYLRSREPFIEGLAVLPRLDRITQAAISGIIDDVVASLGGSVAAVALEQGGNPLPAYTLAKGEKAKLGSVTSI